MRGVDGADELTGGGGSMKRTREELRAELGGDLSVGSELGDIADVSAPNASDGTGCGDELITGADPLLGLMGDLKSPDASGLAGASVL